MFYRRNEHNEFISADVGEAIEGAGVQAKKPRERRRLSDVVSRERALILVLREILDNIPEERLVTFILMGKICTLREYLLCV